MMNRVSRHIPWTVILFLTLGFVFLVAAPAPVHAGGTVENCNDESAFDSVLIGGGLVTFNCGDQNKTAIITLHSTKTISTDTTIDGGGKITLDGEHAIRLFEVNFGVKLTLKNIVLTSGYGSSSDGGAIHNAGILFLDHTTIENSGNSNFYGAAIATVGVLNVTNSEFLNNNAGSGGAIYATTSNAVVTISASRFQGNLVTSSNPDSNRGGAIFIANNATLTLSSSQVYSNTGAYGSGIANGSGTVNDNSKITLSDDTLAFNKSTGNGNGGGIYNLGTANVTNVSFVQNSIRTGNGGGLSNKGTATLSGVTMSANKSTFGGGIANDQGTLTVTGSTFSGNSVDVTGGGGIANELGTITVSETTLSGNFASGEGGGVLNSHGTATLTNVTISDNFSSDSVGMSNSYGGTATLTNVTLYGNSSGNIGNQNDVDTHLHLTNVIIANSKQGDNCVFQKPPDSSDHNLSSDATCNFGIGRDSVKIKLGPLETNGGPTLTRRPLFGSSAIDAGVFVNSILTDQRSVTRPKGTAFDAGAVEFVPCAGAPTKPGRLAPGKKAKTPQVLLDWDGPDCAIKFSVVVRQDSTGGPIVFSESKLKTSQATTTALAAGHTYFWQVTACNGGGCTVSDWWKFKRK